MGLGTFAMSTSKFVSRIQDLALQAKLSLHEGSWRHPVHLACNGTPHNVPPFCKKEVIKSPQRYKLETIVLRNRKSCASSPNRKASYSPLHRLVPYQLRIQQPMSKTRSYTMPGGRYSLISKSVALVELRSADFGTSMQRADITYSHLHMRSTS